MKRVLVIGGAGFVGCNLALYLTERGYRVTVLDNLVRRGSELNLPLFKTKGITFIHGDVRCKEDFETLPNFDAICETSAQTSATAGYANPYFDFSNNTVGLINVLEFARKRGSTVIFWSTNKVYSGDKINKMHTTELNHRYDWSDADRIIGFDSKHGISEEFSVDGGQHSIYGLSKLMSDLAVQEYANAFNVKTVVNRFSCLTGDTKIPLLTGETKTIQELYDNKEENFYVYSIDKAGEIVPGLCEKIIYMGKRKNSIKILLDNNKTVHCTEDHLIMLRDGTYTKASDLCVGDRLMPLYRKYSKINKGRYDYEKIYNPKTNRYSYTHRIISKNKTGFYTKKGLVIHHKDYNRFNNCPSNLEVVNAKEHAKMHSTLIKQLYSDPLWRRATIRKLKKAFNTPEYKEKRKKISEARKGDVTLIKKFSDARIEYYNNPLHREEQSERMKKIRDTQKSKKIYNKIYSSDAYKDKRKKITTNLWKDPTYVNNVKEGLKKTKQLRSVIAKRKWEDPLFREKMLFILKNNGGKLSNSVKTAWADNAKRKNIMEGIQRDTPNRSERMKKLWENPENREKWLRGRHPKKYLNHKIKQIIRITRDIDVYDLLNVTPYNNFAVDSGIFVHNCLYGPKQWGIPEQGWATFFVIAAHFNLPITYYGWKGKQVRDMLFIDDVCRLVEMEIEHIDDINGEVFNIGGGHKNTLSLLEATALLEKMLSVKMNITTSLAVRKADHCVYVSDIRKVKEKIGWVPTIDVVTGYEKIIRWVLDNDHILERMYK